MATCLQRCIADFTEAFTDGQCQWINWQCNLHKRCFSPTFLIVGVDCPFQASRRSRDSRTSPVRGAAKRDCSASGVRLAMFLYFWWMDIIFSWYPRLPVWSIFQHTVLNAKRYTLLYVWPRSRTRGWNCKIQIRVHVARRTKFLIPFPPPAILLHFPRRKYLIVIGFHYFEYDQTWFCYEKCWHRFWGCEHWRHKELEWGNIIDKGKKGNATATKRCWKSVTDDLISRD